MGPLILFLVLVGIWYLGVVCGRKWGTVPQIFEALKSAVTKFINS